MRRTYQIGGYGSSRYAFKTRSINSSAMGFITPQAAEELQYEYGQDSELGQFISSILDDTDKESEDGTYVFKDLRIWMSKEAVA